MTDEIPDLVGAVPTVVDETGASVDIVFAVVNELTGSLGIGIGTIVKAVGYTAAGWFLYTLLKGAVKRKLGEKDAVGKQAYRLAMYEQQRAEGKMSHRVTAALIVGVASLKAVEADANDREAWAQLANIRRKIGL